MKHIHYTMALFVIAFIIYGCANERYPEGMTNAERKEYYKNFNESKTDEEWESIRAERRANSSESTQVLGTVGDENKGALVGSIAISIKNNSLFTKKLRIADNILDFKPLKTRYVGFAPNTKVYLIKGDNEEDEYLFTISERDEGKSFRISE